MLRQVIILLGKTPIFKREYGKSLSWEALSPILSSLTDFLQQSPEDMVEFMNIVNMKVCYATSKTYNMLVIFVTDQTDKEETIKDQTLHIRDTFISKCSEFLTKGNYNQEVYDSIRFDTDEAFRELRPKIALVGFSGVGKTTITRLIRAEEIPMKHIPTITGDVAAIKVGSLHMFLWDFAGQEQFSFIWSRFVKGSDAIILVVDSSQQNMKESKFFVDLIRKEAPKARVAIVANKQDIPGALSAAEIVKVLGYRTYPLVAIDPKQRGAMLNIIAEVVEVTTGITSLIQPMLERESMVETAEAAIMQGNLLKASEIYRNIAELSENMGEDDMAIKFRDLSRLLASQVQAAAQQIQETKLAKSLTAGAAPRVEFPYSGAEVYSKLVSPIESAAKEPTMPSPSVSVPSSVTKDQIPVQSRIAPPRASTVTPPTTLPITPPRAPPVTPPTTLPITPPIATPVAQPIAQPVTPPSTNLAPETPSESIYLFPVLEEAFEAGKFPKLDAPVLKICDKEHTINDIVKETGLSKLQVMEIIKKYEKKGKIKLTKILPKIMPLAEEAPVPVAPSSAVKSQPVQPISEPSIIEEALNIIAPRPAAKSQPVPSTFAPSIGGKDEKEQIAALEKELAEINDVIVELKKEMKEMNPAEYEKEMFQLEDRKTQIHKKIMELRMNLIKKLAV